MPRKGFSLAQEKLDLWHANRRPGLLLRPKSGRPWAYQVFPLSSSTLLYSTLLDTRRLNPLRHTHIPHDFSSSPFLGLYPSRPGSTRVPGGGQLWTPSIRYPLPALRCLEKQCGLLDHNTHFSLVSRHSSRLIPRGVWIRTVSIHRFLPSDWTRETCRSIGPT